MQPYKYSQFIAYTFAKAFHSIAVLASSQSIDQWWLLDRIQGFITACSGCCNTTATLNHYKDHVSRLNYNVIAQTAAQLVAAESREPDPLPRKKWSRNVWESYRASVLATPCVLHGGSEGPGGDWGGGRRGLRRSPRASSSGSPFAAIPWKETRFWWDSLIYDTSTQQYLHRSLVTQKMLSLYACTIRLHMHAILLSRVRS